VAHILLLEIGGGHIHAVHEGFMQNRISILRREKGLSLTDLAKAAGTTKAQIQKLERGDRRLSLDWMDRLARALGVKASDLLPFDAVACQHGPEEQQILAIVSQLPMEDRIVLVRIATDLLNTLRRWDEQRVVPAVVDDFLAIPQPQASTPMLNRRRRGA
jgi:transcriptional regulator with XRE-family HTH domain